MELRAVLWVLWPQAADDSIIDTLYDLIDDDGSGKIMENEFVSKMEELTKEVMEEKKAAREARRKAAIEKKKVEQRQRKDLQKPEFSYREREIDRRWYALLREKRFGFPVVVPDDPVARMEREEEKKEALRIRKMFFELDKDGSGAIEKEELALLGEHLFGEIMTPAQLDLAMGEMDPDGSGEISFEEFHAWFLSEGEFRQKALEEERNNKRIALRKIFEDVDTDGGGSIDKDEVKRLARTLFDIELSPLELKRAMKEMDPDGSGEVDFEEFCAWYFGDGAFRKKVEEEQKRRDIELAQQAEVEAKQLASQNKLAWLKDMFSAVDEDGSGAIDSDEVAELVNKIFGTRMGPEQLQRCMDDMDPDGSGEVDFGEFATWCNREVPLDRLDDIYGWRLVQHQALAGSGGKLQYAMSRLLRMWFNEADTDGGGSLEGKEVAKLASVLLGRELNVYETERLMEQMDPVVRCEVCDGGRVAHVKCKNCGGKGKTGGDGEVDFLEFEVRQQLLSVAAVAACLLACLLLLLHTLRALEWCTPARANGCLACRCASRCILRNGISA
jgi:Ca2+-binding EF-hand superfamily protein